MAALNNGEVLANLKQQLVTAEETRLKIIGAIGSRLHFFGPITFHDPMYKFV